MAAPMDLSWRNGKKLVFTSGCFDILHAGHVLYLEAARKLGDLLVVALNDDDSVRRLKGTGRPVYPAAERAEVLAALQWVDRVIVFSGERPLDLIEALRPEMYVKDESYRDRVARKPGADIPEITLVRRLGGTAVFLERIPGFSTTAVLDAIRDKTGPIRLPDN